jgi:hypothetical protein
MDAAETFAGKVFVHFPNTVDVFIHLCFRVYVQGVVKALDV